MSHLKLRSENNCLNCGTGVVGRFCHVCGQENVEVKESFLHLIRHFLEDLTHFDGKLWVTIKLLLFKPAKLTQLYMDGKRASYIHPIRMYLFVSAVFFFFIFSFSPNEPIQKSSSQPQELNPSMTVTSTNHQLGIHIGEDTVHYKSVVEYEQAQKLLSADKRDNWFSSAMTKKSISINEKYNHDKIKIGAAILEHFEHYFARMLYISLPLFALFLWFLYRRNKNHFFVDHLIFSIHIYCAFFIILFLIKLFNSGTNLLFNKSFTLITILTPLVLCFYLYKALRNHFNQSRGKTIFKFIILNFFTVLLMGVLMTLFILLSLFNI